MASTPRTVIVDEVAEATTSRFVGTLVDETGAALGSAGLQTLTLTLYAVGGANPIINSVNGTNILNVDRGTIDAAGAWVITLTPSDNDLVLTPERPLELHRMLLQWTYAAGVKAGKHEIDFGVRTIGKVA